MSITPMNCGLCKEPIEAFKDKTGKPIFPPKMNCDWLLREKLEPVHPECASEFKRKYIGNTETIKKFKRPKGA